jgi:hypothetical protein
MPQMYDNNLKTKDNKKKSKDFFGQYLAIPKNVFYFVIVKLVLGLKVARCKSWATFLKSIRCELY